MNWSSFIKVWWTEFINVHELSSSKFMNWRCYTLLPCRCVSVTESLSPRQCRDIFVAPSLSPLLCHRDVSAILTLSQGVSVTSSLSFCLHRDIYISNVTVILSQSRCLWHNVTVTLSLSRWLCHYSIVILSLMQCLWHPVNTTLISVMGVMCVTVIVSLPPGHYRPVLSWPLSAFLCRPVAVSLSPCPCHGVPPSPRHCHPVTVAVSLTPYQCRPIFATVSQSSCHCHAISITIPLSPCHWCSVSDTLLLSSCLCHGVIVTKICKWVIKDKDKDNDGLMIFKQFKVKAIKNKRHRQRQRHKDNYRPIIFKQVKVNASCTCN